MPGMEGMPDRATTTCSPTAVAMNDDLLISELAANTPREIASRRHSPRFHATMQARVVKGNFSDRVQGDLTGTTVDISQGGCRVIFDRAVQVGDVYRLDLHASTVKLPRAYARCVRASMLHDDSVEAGFSFFVPLEESVLRDAMDRLADDARRAA